MTRRRNSLLVAGEALLLVAGVSVAILCSRAGDWDPWWLVATLLCLAVVSDALALQAGRLRISGAFSALVLAMALLGPAPAVAIGLASTAVDAWRARVRADVVVMNLATYAVFPLVGGLILQVIVLGDAVTYSGIVFAVFLATNLLNFGLVYGYFVLRDGKSWTEGIKQTFLPVLPVECATGLLTAGVVLIQMLTGLWAVLALAMVVLSFQYMLGTAIAAVERGNEVERRNAQLASLQFGLISMTLKTLSLRDNMTARHSAAVARYSREMAIELGLGEEEQELIHTAGLFHDIGKFIFPDSILLTDRKLSEQDFEIVKRHPVVGAELIAEIEGYGPIAQIVRSHHERIDGRGYPDGLHGDEIPLGSRIIAVADTYDVITSRDTYRTPMSAHAAFEELRRSAGTQLDARLVDLFIRIVETRGIAFQHSTARDFEAELALDRRVRDYAVPRIAA